MKIQKIKVIAKAKGIKSENLEKPELIRSIQKAEGNFDCYGAATGFCDQANCMWREDCISKT
ncbi:MAG: SAP domain-containing protein [Nitrospirae bacterium]|nr:SAP domain-containing protein [Nitrospirota bacterium]